MNRLRIFLGCALWVWACAASAGESEAPSLLESTRGATEVAGIGQVRTSSLVDGKRELRIWSGFGAYPVNQMGHLRIGRDGQVRGDILRHYASDLGWMEPNEAKHFRREVLKDCMALKPGADTGVCMIKPRRKLGWRVLHERLLELRILSLPDESKLPPPDLDIGDGSVIAIEIGQGTDYRAYQYSNAWARSGPEVVAADQIVRTVRKAALP